MQSVKHMKSYYLSQNCTYGRQGVEVSLQNIWVNYKQKGALYALDLEGNNNS